ncbi:BlaI/MecI/CopY family transcriptional regulator [Cupriavidus gilardii]|uniref:BlaI/MecI/CopY family transcriptional regulator n=1 Tax=Cupriavidus gilardii TaxID=82541 RepID=UPI0018E6D555|nr:BlaI/MecI/CopY family transcriptional regulator [Cupriavidus sp. ISTL7]
MPKTHPNKQYEVLLDLVSHHPEGVGIEQIDAGLHGAATRRTVQRWLNDLIAQGYLRRERAGRATRYRAATMVTAAGNVKLELGLTGRGEIRVPLAAEAESIQAHVLQPLGRRPAARYNRASRHFLRWSICPICSRSRTSINASRGWPRIFR